MGGIIFWLIFGGLVGWIASKIMGTDAQQGVLLNIIVGIVGAFIGGFLWGMISGDPEPYGFWDIGSWITAIIGACILLFLVGMVTGRRRV
ncbi:MAG TPA: GlsB/YeaQ/YmgE family stress response membrane protein [Herpetosiphonaceae bacterium]